MKIKTIRFQNINSLRKEHVIDFTASPLKEAGLFAITGRTGSGKTTLLDVICLAIYNQVPRFDGKTISKPFIERTGSILTRNTEEAYAEVIYECHAGTYRSRWSISTARTGNLRDYEMEISDEQTGKLLDLKKSEVPKKNEELMGLNYSQFIRSIMLAQGDFAKFLQSDKAERGELLEKITGGEIYRKIGQEAYKMKKEYAGELEKLQIREADLREELMSKEEYEQKQKAFDELEKKMEQLEKNQKKLDEAIKLKERINETQQLYLNAQHKEEGQRKKWEEFNATHGEKLEMHRKLLPCEENLRNWEQQQKQLQDHLKKEKQIRKNLEDSEMKEKEAHQKAESFLNKKKERDQLIPALEQFQKQVNALEQEISTLLTEYNNKAEKAAELLEDLNFQAEVKDIQAVRQEYKQMQDRTNSRNEELNAQLPNELLKEPTASLDSLKKSLEVTTEWITAAKRAEDYEEAVKKQDEKIQHYQEKLKTFPDEIKKAEQQEKTLKLELENLRKEEQINKLTADLEEQRKNLESRQPCPLCGSTHHPYVEEYMPETHDLSGQIKKKEKAYSSALSHLKNLQSEEKSLKETLAEARKEKDRNAGELKEREEEIEKLKNQLPKTYHDYQPGDLKKEIQQKQQLLEEWINLQDRLKRMNELKPLMDKLKKVKEQGVMKRKELESLYSGKDIQQDVSRLRNDLNDAAYNLKTAKNEQKRWEQEMGQMKDLLGKTEKRLQPEMERLGYSSISEARKNLLSAKDYESLKEQKTTIESAISAAETEKKTHAGQYEKLKEQDSGKPRETLKEELMELNDHIREERAKRDELNAHIRYQVKQTRTLEEVRKEIEKQKKENEKWFLLNDYIGDAEGKKFSTFAQQLTLEQLVQLANKRIASLSDRYKLDIPGGDEDESLVVLDMDMGAQRRSVKTLSGGESFLISLSLALALSDLASRNVEIKSLFVDEGFGSLDQVTLDQTLDSLEKLQAESEKTIGVISHIDALKERMDTQIEIVRDGQGFSSINIKAG